MNGHFDNESSNEYEKKFKIKKYYKNIFLLINWWQLKFHVILSLFDSPSNTVKLKPLQNT
jgi:hypothetical protein